MFLSNLFNHTIKPMNDALGKSLNVKHIPVVHVPMTHIVDVKSGRTKPNGENYRMSEIRFMRDGLRLKV
jgi:hypothetical protein